MTEMADRNNNRNVRNRREQERVRATPVVAVKTPVIESYKIQYEDGATMVFDVGNLEKITTALDNANVKYDLQGVDYPNNDKISVQSIDIVDIPEDKAKEILPMLKRY